MTSSAPDPILAFTQGDPAGVGPEILLRLAEHPPTGFAPLLFVERAAIEAVIHLVPGSAERIEWGGTGSDPRDAARRGRWLAIDPAGAGAGEARVVTPGRPTAADARGALAALDAALDAALAHRVDALVTAPLAKATIAEHVFPSFRGHTEYLAERCGLERYGRDYLMTFLAPDLTVALLSTHVSLRQAIDGVAREAVLDAVRLFARHVTGPLAVAAIDPHAGESGWIGDLDDREVRPAVEAARAEGLDVSGPHSADSLFARARRGEFAGVLALYHDQGLIAVKTAAFGQATNWTMGLPFLRTSVDHGTAFDIAGRGLADAEPMREVVKTTLRLLGRQGRSGGLHSSS
jgi:4-hydroxythreonine-4-phosphate dehydrogenase